MANSYGELGNLARLRGDYDEAARHYQRALDIRERLSDQAGMATGYSQLGNLEKERGGSITADDTSRRSQSGTASASLRLLSTICAASPHTAVSSAPSRSPAG